jgi:hypothetical protein
MCRSHHYREITRSIVEIISSLQNSRSTGDLRFVPLGDLVRRIDSSFDAEGRCSPHTATYVTAVQPTTGVEGKLRFGHRNI